LMSHGMSFEVIINISSFLPNVDQAKRSRSSVNFAASTQDLDHSQTYSSDSAAAIIILAPALHFQSLTQDSHRLYTHLRSTCVCTGFLSALSWSSHLQQTHTSCPLPELKTTPVLSRKRGPKQSKRLLSLLGMVTKHSRFLTMNYIHSTTRSPTREMAGALLLLML